MEYGWIMDGRMGIHTMDKQMDDRWTNARMDD